MSMLKYDIINTLWYDNALNMMTKYYKL